MRSEEVGTASVGNSFKTFEGMAEEKLKLCLEDQVRTLGRKGKY